MIYGINELRDEIEIIDKKLSELILKRLEICERVGEIKKNSSLPSFVPEREKAILKRTNEAFPEKYRQEADDIYKAIITAGRNVQIKTNAAEAVFRILIVNGPNLQMLGKREPDIYGAVTYESLKEIIIEHCTAKNIYAEFFQSDYEGDLVSAVNKGLCFDSIVINPGAYTHTSLALADALAGYGNPYAEVHISDLARREDFRKVSLTRASASFYIEGRGIEGYTDAIDELYNMYLLKKTEKEIKKKRKPIKRMK